LAHIHPATIGWNLAWGRLQYQISPHRGKKTQNYAE